MRLTVPTHSRARLAPRTGVCAVGANAWTNPPGRASGSAAAVHTQPVLRAFTIKKFIDKASPDLLLACCKSGSKDGKKIAWAILSIRETGDFIKAPYLVLEFQGLWVDAFNWSLSPGAEATSASQEETVTFSSETILIKYARQESTGMHTPIKVKGWNRVLNSDAVDPLPSVEALRG